MKYSVSLVSTTRGSLTAAGMLITEAGQRMLVEANVPNLGSCAPPVVPELGGKGT
jgi:hypothetical protein